ncbi:Tudor domain-containing protein 7 [Frankliniella fusca]|uniref:Tudor domain-containing protein 7 n=1 Tax=Frankliniella fusca TaxID=407009 RepID=A0AAE1H464_9NEOP|nr:Tudor domain-containing protein 7 [Frankliniella fusca]
MKIREAHFDPAKPGIVSIKYNYNSNPIEVNVKDKRGRPVNLTTYTPGSAYNAKFPLAENKIEDLKDLIRSGAIPSKYHAFYKSVIDIGAAQTNDHLQCSEDCADCCDNNDVEQEEIVLENQ